MPLALQEQLHEGDKYKVSMTDTSIVLEKVSQPLTVEEWFQRVEELGPDPDQLSLEEICEIVKEVRRERRTQQC